MKKNDLKYVFNSMCGYTAVDWKHKRTTLYWELEVFKRGFEFGQRETLKQVCLDDGK